MTDASGLPGSEFGFRRLEEQEVFKGWAFRTVVASFEAPDGSTFTRDFVRSPGAVGVVPLLFDPDGSPVVVLVRQYRPALERDMLEIPAGLRDVDGEHPADTAQRELIEEAGFRAGRIVFLHAFHNSAGMTDALTHLFVAVHLEATPTEAHGVEEEHMTIEQYPLAEALALIENGEITDAKTVIGLLLAARWLDRQ